MVNYVRAFYYLHNLNKRAYWNCDSLRGYQDKKLRRIIKHAYDYVPFYHKKFKELGIHPSSIKTVKDLNRLPIITKDEMKRSPQETIFTDLNVHNLKKLSTSGSTGEPFFLYVSRAESEFRKAKHLRANIACGQKLRDRWVTITAPHHFGEATNLQRTLGFYAPNPVSVFNKVSTQISIIKRMEPDVLDGYSSSLLILAKEIERKQEEAIRPRFVIGGAELIDDHSRRYLEKVFGVPFYDQYSSVELERMAWQCPAQQGYHMDSDAIIMQFVDRSGEEVNMGERGEIVCTSLYSYAMPFIRYAIGDVGIPLDGACTCGRTLPLMKAVEGRKDSLLVLPDGQMLTPRTFTIAMNMFKYYADVDQFRVVQKRRDLFEFSIAMKDDSALEESVVEAELVHHFKNMFKLKDVRFEMKFVKEISLDKSGKLMAVVSHLKNVLQNGH